MARRLTLRQVEAFKAVIENGSISSAAQMIHISQPAMSKLIAHFEEDTGLKLFERLKNRLAPTACGMRLYNEIDRIFAGVRQIENAAEAIRRQEYGQLGIGVLPALSGSFIQRATMNFLKDRRDVFCVVQSLTSEAIVHRMIAGKLDVGVIGGGFDNPRFTFEPLIEHPLVCIAPLSHPLAAKNVIVPSDLNHIPFVSFEPDTYVGRLVEEMFETSAVKAELVLFANMAPTLCEFVAAGLGVSLVHPLMISGFEDKLAVRRFEPEIPYKFHLCYRTDGKSAQLIEAFAERLRVTAVQISRAMLSVS